jgi:hypothetical protein
LSIGPEEIALVLTEDGPYGDGPVLMQRRAHVLSTRQWLKTLERLGLIPSSQAIIDEIQAGGRRVARYMADRPAETDGGTRSDWKDGTEAVVANLRENETLGPGDEGDV